MSEAESKFLLNESGGADHVATGYRLMQELDALGEHGRALVVSQKLAQDLTKSGQTSQAASILQRLSPEGSYLTLLEQQNVMARLYQLQTALNSRNWLPRYKINQVLAYVQISLMRYLTVLSAASKLARMI